MWELDHKENWALKNWCCQTVLKTLKSPLDSKEIKPVNLKGNQPWIFTKRTDAEAVGPIVWPPDGKNQLIGMMLGKIEGRKRRGWQKMRWLDGTSPSIDMNLSKVWEIVKDKESWRSVVHGVANSWTQLSDSTTTKGNFKDCVNNFKTIIAHFQLNIMTRIA